MGGGDGDHSGGVGSPGASDGGYPLLRSEGKLHVAGGGEDRRSEVVGRDVREEACGDASAHWRWGG